jgi:hypothetical protein
MRPGSSLSSLWGSIELAQFDRSALGRFDLSEVGFWRSFSVVLVLAPLFLLVAYLQNTYMLRHGGSAEPYNIALLVFLLDFAAFNILMAPIAHFLGVGQHYRPAMTVFNWCRPVAFAFFLPVYAAGAAGIAAPGTILFLLSLALTMRSVYLGYILHLALKATLGPILAILLLDFVLGQFIVVVLRKTFLA